MTSGPDDETNFEPLPDQKLLWREGWSYFSTIVAVLVLLIMLANVFVAAEVFHEAVNQWIGVGVAALGALLIWLRERAQQLGVMTIKKPPPGGEDETNEREPTAEEQLPYRPTESKHDQDGESDGTL